MARNEWILIFYLQMRATGDKLEERFIIPIARELAVGLHAIHEAGIIHRDVKGMTCPVCGLFQWHSRLMIFQLQISLSMKKVAWRFVISVSLEFFSPSEISDQHGSVHLIGCLLRCSRPGARHISTAARYVSRLLFVNSLLKFN